MPINVFTVAPPQLVVLNRTLHVGPNFTWPSSQPVVDASGGRRQEEGASCYVVWQSIENESTLVRGESDGTNWYAIANSESFRVGTRGEEVPDNEGRMIAIVVRIGNGGSMSEVLWAGGGKTQPTGIDLCAEVQRGVDVSAFTGQSAALWISTRRMPEGDGWNFIKHVNASGEITCTDDVVRCVGDGCITLLRDNHMLDRPLWMKLKREPR